MSTQCSNFTGILSMFYEYIICLISKTGIHATEQLIAVHVKQSGSVLESRPTQHLHIRMSKNTVKNVLKVHNTTEILIRKNIHKKKVS